jgi:hypothetical protein
MESMFAFLTAQPFHSSVCFDFSAYWKAEATNQRLFFLFDTVAITHLIRETCWFFPSSVVVESFGGAKVFCALKPLCREQRNSQTQ